MPYLNRPRGFQLRSPEANVEIRSFAVPSSDTTLIGIGEPVKLVTGGALLIDDVWYPTVARSAAGDRLLGVVVGVDPYIGRTEASINLSIKHKPASTQSIVKVCIDREALFECQLDPLGTDITAAEVGENCDHVTALDCDAVTGISKQELDQSTHSASDGQFRLVSVVSRPDNLTFEDYVSVLVKINESAYSTEAGI